MSGFFGETKADKYMLIGTILIGMVIPGPIGLILIFYGMYLEHKDRKHGKAVRPAVITALSIWGMTNGLINLFGAHTQLFAYDDAFLKPIIHWYGTFIDHRYWAYGYNTAPWGGVADPFETDTNITNAFFIHPIFTVAFYGLFRMKRWGYRWALIISWVYAYHWIFYLCHHTLSGNVNVLNAGYPIWGWMIMNYPYLTQFFAIPYLHTVDKDIFKK